MANFKTNKVQSDPYYRTGHYLTQITLAKVNSRGEPYFTFKVLDSHDGAHINSYYTINFFMGELASQPSQDLWNRKFSDLMGALGIASDKGEFDVELDKLLGKEVVLAYTKKGFNPLPNFIPVKSFDKNWQPKDKTSETQKTADKPYEFSEQTPDDWQEDHSASIDALLRDN